MIFNCKNEADTKNLAIKLAKNINNDKPIIYLAGDLGAGKTTFARSFIKHFGFKKVKSPTYAIVEPYEAEKIKIYHFDLYRLCDFEELEMIGIREYFDEICLIEWADNFVKYLPKCDLQITLTGNNEREISISSKTKLGEKLLNLL
jgi:tRNA threonylcarbamoyladenosine biosynthesis protein TsaE